MTMQTSALDEYLKQVERYLPPWNAKEIVSELRSHVLDQAEGIAAERGVDLDEAIIRETLAHLGAPQQLAAGYVPAVALIRPEYTLPFAIYSVGATALLIPLLFAAGLGAWLLGVVVAVGLLFAGFVALSRLPQVYRLPLWHPKLGRVVFRMDVGQGLRRGVHAIWPQPAMAGVPGEPGQPGQPLLSVSTESRGAATTAPGGASAVWPPSASPSSTSAAPFMPRRTPTEWLIAHSGPRALRIHELFEAGMRAVFGFALALFFTFSPSPFPILDLHFDDPQRAFRLIVQAPGLEAAREVGAIACMALCASGLLSIFLGKCRLGLYASIASKAAWAVLLYSLMVGGPVFALSFDTFGWVADEWPRVQAAIQSGTPVVLFIALLLQLLGLVWILVRLGMMEAWYRSQPGLD
jgi:hypothetical protein